MKNCLSFAILIIAFISLNGCSQSSNKQAPLKKETIKTLDSSKTYHDYLPDHETGDSNLPDVIKPE